MHSQGNYTKHFQTYEAFIIISKLLETVMESNLVHLLVLYLSIFHVLLHYTYTPTACFNHDLIISANKQTW